MSDCDCPYCGKQVTANDQYMIEHELGFYGDVVHKVYHIACLEIKPSQGSGSTSSEVAASTSRSKEANDGER